MSESKTWFCRTEEDTAEIGRKLASIARRGDCFALYGTLGMGKSVLCRAFIRSLADAGEVPSPTFTLVQSYPAEEFEIYHFDRYRLKSPEEIFELGMEEALCEGGRKKWALICRAGRLGWTSRRKRTAGGLR